MKTLSKNIESKSKNIYVSHLGLDITNNTNTLVHLTRKNENGTEEIISSFEVSMTSTTEYSVEVHYSGENVSLNKKLEYRTGKGLTEEETNKRLRGLQYWTRRILLDGQNLIGLSMEGAVQPETETEVEVQETTQEEITKEVEVTTKTLKAKKKERKLGLEGQIVAMVEEAIESEDAKEIMHSVLKSKLDAWGIVPGKVEIEVKRPDGSKKKVGTQHKDFKKVLSCISANVNIALVGPAGSGKTTCVSEVAKSLDLPFYSKSVSAQTGVHEFFGYQDANGQYVRTIFREAYENGGVFLLDEFDAGNPNVLAALNQATANQSCAFADGMIPKHKDFVVVMAGNTFGHGATSEYVGRNKIDAATLDRFAFIYFGYDEEFEYTLAQNKAWCKKVQSLRKKVEQKKIKTIISPRATFDGAKLLSVGMREKEVMELLIFKGLSKDEVSMLS